MSDPVISDLARIMVDDALMETKVEVAWLDKHTLPAPNQPGIPDNFEEQWSDLRRFVSCVRFDPNRNVIEIVCCPD